VSFLAARAGQPSSCVRCGRGYVLYLSRPEWPRSPLHDPFISCPIPAGDLGSGTRGAVSGRPCCAAGRMPPGSRAVSGLVASNAGGRAERSPPGVLGCARRTPLSKIRQPHVVGSGCRKNRANHHCASTCTDTVVYCAYVRKRALRRHGAPKTPGTSDKTRPFTHPITVAKPASTPPSLARLDAGMFDTRSSSCVIRRRYAPPSALFHQSLSSRHPTPDRSAFLFVYNRA
jgi:hypothetical protein